MDLDGDVEVADEPSDHGDLLRVLLAEVRALRTDDVEELHAHGRDAAKVAGAMVAFEPVRRALGLDPGRESGRVQLVRCRREQEVDARGRRECRVAVEIAWIPVEIRSVAELRRVDEQARDHETALGARGAEQRGVSLVQGTHRRHEAE